MTRKPDTEALQKVGKKHPQDTTREEIRASIARARAAGVDLPEGTEEMAIAAQKAVGNLVDTH